MSREAWKESGTIYGYRKLYGDLCDLGETCCQNRVARLARLAGIHGQTRYKRRPEKYGGKPSIAVVECVFNLLKRESIRRRTYKTRENARADVLKYIEMFHNPRRKHAWRGMLSLADFVRKQALKLHGV
ncbi:hypothetical protein A9Q94_05280 [Rhodobacterales bacterium 56_14_T64]|nr:hypothetical protein A9Q94_05280 [Rhodobacterales bacterium 56_14_T64]